MLLPGNRLPENIHTWHIVHGLVSLSECNTPKGYHRLDLRSASTGSLKWSKILPSKDAQEKQQVLYSLDALDPHHGYFLIGSTLYKVHLKDGALSWSFVSSTTKIWESLEFHEGMVYLIGRTQSQSQEITVTMIDSMTGTKDTTGSYSLTNYDTIGSLFTIKTLAKGEAPALHLVSTLLSGTTQIHPIGGKRNGWTTMPNTRNANSVPSGLHTFSGFIASSSSSDSDSQQKVVKVKYSGKKYDFETLVDFEQTSTASFYAATRVKGEFIGLAHLEPAIDKKQLKVTLLDLSLKKPVKKSYTIQWDSSSLATIERASLGGSFTTPTLVILTTDGMVHFIQKEGVIGSRDESLSEIVDDVFVPLHQSLDDATAKDKFALKNFGWIQNPYLAIEELSKKVSWALVSIFLLPCV